MPRPRWWSSGAATGLVCACYLARAGLDVVVLEAGGYIHTVEPPAGVPGAAAAPPAPMTPWP